MSLLCFQFISYYILILEICEFFVIQTIIQSISTLTHAYTYFSCKKSLQQATRRTCKTSNYNKITPPSETWFSGKMLCPMQVSPILCFHCTYPRLSVPEVLEASCDTMHRDSTTKSLLFTTATILSKELYCLRNFAL